MLPIFIASLSFAVEPEPGPNDAKAILGNWKIVKITIQGKEDDSYKDRVMRITKEKFALIGKDDKDEDPATYSLDPKKKPAWIDLTEKNKTLRGIYKLEKGKLTLCIPEEDKDNARPTSFDEKTHRVILFERAKAKE